MHCFILNVYNITVCLNLQDFSFNRGVVRSINIHLESALAAKRFAYEAAELGRQF